jgi:hypothetical protein
MGSKMRKEWVMGGGLCKGREPRRIFDGTWVS